jgi:hypothetical protein
MSIGKTATALILGFVVIAAITAALYTAPAFGARHAVTGMAAGVGVAYLGFILYFLLMPRPDEKGFSFFKSYVPGMMARYVVLIGAFCAVIFWLKMEALSVLLGAFAGMMAATFVSLVKMRRPAKRPPGA